MNIIKEVRDFVEQECLNPNNVQGYDPFKHHFIPVVEHAKRLAKELNADQELLEITAWLHDIGSIKHGRKNHHITGAKIAEEKLKQFNYSREKIELIKKCILNHRGSKENSRETTEEQIIAEADTLACFDDITGIFQAAFCWEGHKTRNSAKKAVIEKLIRKYNKLHFESSKKLIKPKYEAAMLLFS